jgi:hypothetical protein
MPAEDALGIDGMAAARGTQQIKTLSFCSHAATSSSL